VNYYQLAEEEIDAVKALYDAGKYRHAVYHSCLCMEYLLKTKLVQLEPTSVLLDGHDIINIFKVVHAKHKSTKDLRSVIGFCRKYFNEARYPSSGTEAYTKEFAEEFMQYMNDIKLYIDNECTSTVEDLMSKFKK
jgi:HEPN domain-containing protein